MSLSFLLPSLALLLGISVSVYLFIDWLRHGRRPWFLLMWSGALFLMYWFQVPIILTNLGNVITVTDFNFFFALTLPLTFLAPILIYLGLIELTSIRLHKAAKVAIALWFLSAVLFFIQQFIVNDGIIKTPALPLIANLAFYLPLRLLIVTTLGYWLFRPSLKSASGRIGAAFIILESLLGGARNILAVKTVLTYPPEFWYVAMSQLHSFFLLQTLSVIVAALGFFCLHLMYYRRHFQKAW